MLDELCAVLGLEQVDVVGQRHRWRGGPGLRRPLPGRIRTLTLTNCDVHDNFPPELFKPFVDMAQTGEFGPLVAAMAGDFDLARSEAGLGKGYAAAARADRRVAHELSRTVRRRPGQGPRALPRRAKAEELMAVEPLLAAAAARRPRWPGARRISSSSRRGRSACRELIPCIERVTLVPDAMLFWPDERAADLVPLLRDFWEAHA